MPDGPPTKGQDASRCARRNRRDPLGNVISWLDNADLGDDFAGGGICGDSLAGARKQLAETPSEGLAAPTSVPWDPGAGVRRVPSARLPPATQPRVEGNHGASSSRQGPQPASCWPAVGSPCEKNVSSGLVSEEEEWDARQKQTGAACRLVMYELENPRNDFLLRGGGSSGRRIMVASVTDDGTAAKAGVKAGDVLVSISGKKDFVGKSADFVHATLSAPVTLVFMGFCGNIQAEVRLNYEEVIAGVPTQHQVVAGSSHTTVQLIDEIVFQPSSAPLWLATAPSQLPAIPAGFQALPASRGLPPVSPTTDIDLDALELGGGPPRAVLLGNVASVACTTREATLASSKDDESGGFGSSKC